MPPNYDEDPVIVRSSRFDSSLWSARHLRGYTRALRRLKQAQNQTDQQIRVEAVYISLRSPLGKSYGAYATWIVYNTWTTQC